MQKVYENKNIQIEFDTEKVFSFSNWFMQFDANQKKKP